VGEKERERKRNTYKRKEWLNSENVVEKHSKKKAGNNTQILRDLIVLF
jgi:hypothetical protein